MRASFWVLGVIVVAVLAPFGCGGGGGDKSTFVDDGGSTGFGGDANLGDVSLVTPIFGGDGGSRDGGSINPDAQGVFAIPPAGVQTITVAAGQSAPTVSFTATLSGSPVNAGWNVDRGDLGTVTAGPSSTSTFTPSGATGGMVTVTAGFSGKIATAQVFIKLTAHQSGANPSNAGEALQI